MVARLRHLVRHLRVFVNSDGGLDAARRVQELDPLPKGQQLDVATYLVYTERDALRPLPRPRPRPHHACAQPAVALVRRERCCALGTLVARLGAGRVPVAGHVRTGADLLRAMPSPRGQRERGSGGRRFPLSVHVISHLPRLLPHVPLHRHDPAGIRAAPQPHGPTELRQPVHAGRAGQQAEGSDPGQASGVARPLLQSECAGPKPPSVAAWPGDQAHDA
mmetsp:Transcript_4344/g.9399  ORF Transcript_4344/g.9399 Transcript_4344/m.9399 type:complete len:220 (+) Transcript_4344:1290-1949(+)